MRSFTISAIAATVLLFAQEVYAQSTTNMNALMEVLKHTSGLRYELAIDVSSRASC